MQNTKIFAKGIIATSLLFVLPVQTLALSFIDSPINIERKLPESSLFGNHNGKKYHEDRVIIKYKNDTKPFRVITLSGNETVAGALEKYRLEKDVLTTEPDYIAYADATPNDPYFSPYQWNLDNATGSGINAIKAWDIGTGSGVTVAVIDTGVAYESATIARKTYVKAPDLESTCFVPGYDFVNNDSHPNDDNGHGTHVTGTIAQSTNNSLGVAGIAYNACIMPIKVLDASGSGSYSAIANGIYFATDNGAKVINMSLGGSSDSSILRDAVAYAYAHGVTVVAAAGNDNNTVASYPASYNDYVISVGATDYAKNRAPYSNYGPDVDVVAPGGDTTSDLNGDGFPDGILQNTFGTTGSRLSDFNYYFYNGTSMASPHVAGTAALVISHGNAITPDDVRTAIQSTSQDLGTPGKDDQFGYGLIDAFAALNWAKIPPVPAGIPPVANAGFDQTVFVNAPVSFTANQSKDDIAIVGYGWNFGDGSSATTPTATHTYTAVGTYTATLTVTDNEGLTGTDSAVITVKAIPIANVTISAVSASNTKTGGTYSISVSSRNNETTSKIVVYHIDVIDPKGVTVKWSGLTDKTATIKAGGTSSQQWQNKVPANAVKGTYKINAKLSVGGIVTATATKNFTVN